MGTNDNRISAMQQWKVLTGQYARIILSDKKNLLVTLLFPVIAAVITVWIAGENMFVNYEGTKSGNFVIVSAAIWGGLFNTIQVVVKERANIKRDYVTGLRVRCYTASRAILQFILCVIQSGIMLLSYVFVNVIYDNPLPESGIVFGNPLIEFYITILLLIYAADMMGLCISCIVKKTETANVMAPYILIVQLIFSGILFKLTGAGEYVSYAMISKWGMEALGSISDLNSLPLRIQETVPSVPHDVEKIFEATSGHLLTVWGILLAFILVFVVTGNLMLHTVSKDTR